MNIVGALSFDPYSISLVSKLPDVEIFVFIQMDDMNRVETIPNLFELKHEANVKFALYNNAFDIKHRNYLPIMAAGECLIGC